MTLGLVTCASLSSSLDPGEVRMIIRITAHLSCGVQLEECVGEHIEKGEDIPRQRRCSLLGHLKIFVSDPYSRQGSVVGTRSLKKKEKFKQEGSSSRKSGVDSDCLP